MNPGDLISVVDSLIIPNCLLIVIEADSTVEMLRVMRDHRMRIIERFASTVSHEIKSGRMRVIAS